MAKVKEPSNQISEEDLAKIMKGTEKSGAKVTVGDPGSAPGANEAKAKESYEKISKAMSISMSPKTNSNKDVVAVINRQIANDTKNTDRMIKALAGIEKATTEQSSILKESLLENKNNLEAGVLAPDSKIKEDKEDKEKKEEKGPVQSFLEKLIKPALMIAVGAILMSFDKIKKYYDENIKGFVDGLTNLVGPGGALALLGVGIVALLNPLASLLAVVGAFAAFKGLKNLLSGPKVPPVSKVPPGSPGAPPGIPQPGAKGPSQFTKNPDGTITNQKGATYDPKTGTAVSASGKPLNPSATKAMAGAVERNAPNLLKAGTAMRIGRGLAGGAGGLVGGLALDYASEKLNESGYEKLGAGADIASSALTGAGLGATFGAFFGGVGAVPGAAIGGAIGAGVGVFNNYKTLFGKDKKEKEAGDPQREGGDLTKTSEGFEPNIYPDTDGKPTIGYGHQLTPDENDSGIIKIDGKDVDIANGISEPDAAALLKQDQKKYSSEGMGNLEKLGVDTSKLGEGTKTALNDLAYNAGPGIFEQTPKLVEALKNNDLDAIEKEISNVGLTVKGTGDRPKGLANRVESRVDLIRSDAGTQLNKETQRADAPGSTDGKKLASDTKEIQTASINPPAQAVAPVINNITTNNNNPAGQSSPGVINKPGADINPINQMWNTFAFA